MTRFNTHPRHKLYVFLREFVIFVKAIFKQGSYMNADLKLRIYLT